LEGERDFAARQPDGSSTEKFLFCSYVWKGICLVRANTEAEAVEYRFREAVAAILAVAPFLLVRRT
jgi:hypothetical protein